MSTTLNKARPVLEDMGPRLAAASKAVKDSRAALNDDLELRNELIEAAVDHGMSQRKVAAVAGVSLSLVTWVLLHRGAGAQDVPENL